MEMTTGIVITQSNSDTSVTEAGTSDTYTVKLASAPSDTVTVTIATDDQTQIAIEPVQPLKIMPIGDSITHGVTLGNPDTGGYRTFLWNMLQAEGYNVDFVGSRLTGPDSIDRDHEGRRNKRIDEISKFINIDPSDPIRGKDAIDLVGQKPDVVLLLIGTNDILQDSSLATAPDRLSALIDQIIEKSPKTQVLVGSIPPSTEYENDAQQIIDFNNAIPELVNAKVNQGKKVKFVDLNSRISPSDLSDDVHPTPDGYSKIAQGWYDALIEADILRGYLNNPSPQPASNQQTLTFTPDNWDIAQTLTVSAVDDNLVEGTHRSTIAHTASSNDASYNTLATTLTVTVTDNEPGILLIPSDGSNAVSEAGTTDTYSLVLTSQPTANVTLNLSADNQLSPNTPTLTFTPSNWNTPQVVTVSAVDDPVVEGIHTGTIAHSVSSSDPKYDVLEAESIVFNIIDNDRVSVPVDPAPAPPTNPGPTPPQPPIPTPPEDPIAGEVFVFAGATKRQGLRSSTFDQKNYTRLFGFNPREGDRIQLNFDGDLTTVGRGERPTRLFNAGKQNEKTLKQAIESAYEDVNPRRKGDQALKPNQAIIFQHRKQFYLSVNNNKRDFQAKNDLFVALGRMTRADFAPGDFRPGPLTVTDYFV